VLTAGGLPAGERGHLCLGAGYKGRRAAHAVRTRRRVSENVSRAPR